MVLNFFLLLYFLGICPKLLLDRIVKGKKHPALLQRLGFSIPDPEGKQVIWIHAVSVGEVKSAQPLFLELRKLHPAAFFLITTTSATGQAEAKRSLERADAYAYLPIDLTWVVKRWVRRLKPKLFLVVESDFWPNLLAAIRQTGGQIALVSGKISERSSKRFQKFPFFAKKLFSQFDLICVQNEEYRQRFLSFLPNSTIHVTGNLKLDLQAQPVDLDFWREKLSFEIDLPVVTVSCTHAPEEDLLLDCLPPVRILLVPRHPERFEEVAQLLEKKKISFIRWSRIDQKQGSEKVVLVDAMGQLPICYSLSRLAIVGGSFIDRIGGHNVLEPCLYGTPVFFGPHIYGQKEFAARVLESQAGKEVALENLQQSTLEFLNNPSEEKQRRAAAIALIQSGRGVTSTTLAVLRNVF